LIISPPLRNLLVRRLPHRYAGRMRDGAFCVTRKTAKTDVPFARKQFIVQGNVK
jgi:hypothetical protein